MPYEDLRLIVGDDELDLSGKVVDGETGCRVYATADTTFGNPEALTEVLTNLLRNGDQVVGLGYGNRVPEVGLAIEGPSLGAVARAEERIQRDFAGRPALLRWQPDDPTAQPNIFEVSFSSLQHKFDHHEGAKRMRLFGLNLTALPFARAEDPTEIVLNTGGEPPVVISDGSTTVGWSTSAGPIVLTGDPAVRVTNVPAGHFWVKLVPTPFILKEGEYIVVRTYGMVAPSVYVRGAGNVHRLPLHSRRLVSGKIYEAVYGPSTGYSFGYVSEVIMGHVSVEPWWRAWPSLDLVEFWNLSTTSDPSTGRQVLLDFVPGGSAPTYGSMDLHGSTPLGDVLIHTGPTNGGATPPWSGYVADTAIVNAEESADATSPSGRAWALKSGTEGRRFGAEFPASQFDGDGAGVNWLVAKCSTASTEKLVWAARGRAAGEDVGRVVRGEVYHTFSAANQWELIPLGAMPLPPTRVGANGAVQVRVQQEPAGSVGVVSAGDGYLLRVGPDYSTTVLRAGSHSDVRITAPSIDDPTGSIWLGTGGDMFQAGSLVAAGAHKPHTFLPKGTRVWLLTASAAVDLTVSYYRRYHDHVTEPGAS